MSTNRKQAYVGQPWQRPIEDYTNLPIWRPPLIKLLCASVFGCKISRLDLNLDLPTCIKDYLGYSRPTPVRDHYLDLLLLSRSRYIALHTII